MIAWAAIKAFIAPFFEWFVGLLRAIPWQVWAGVALAGLFWWHGIIAHAEGYADAEAEYKDKIANLERAYAQEAAAAVSKARAAERRHAMELDAISSRLILERAEGYEERDRTIADLRAGNVRLRNEWQGCKRMPATSAGASGADAEAELRARGAADIVRLAREADRWIEACQSVIRSDRGLTQ